MAGLFENEALFCTGAFISHTHILTVAICLIKFFKIPYARFETHHAEAGKYLTAFELIKYEFRKVEIHNGYNLENMNVLQDNIGLITVIIVTHSFKMHSNVYFEIF